MELKRKIYQELLEWKEKDNGRTSILIEGVRRVGKSTIAEAFGKNEYKSYVIIDFAEGGNSRIRKSLEDNLSNLDVLFQDISVETGVRLYERDTLIIFDEVQKFPRAREATKYLVKDGRYDWLITGSLISIKENVENITIPSEERKLRMHPLDFEEFLWAAGEEMLAGYIRKCYRQSEALEDAFHKKAMRLFREYLLVGGMPQSVTAYFESSRSFDAADRTKRMILEMYRDDIKKAARKYRSRVSAVFEHIPSTLSSHEKKLVINDIERGGTFSLYDDPLFWLGDAMLCNLCYKCNDPSVGFSLNLNESAVKPYLVDTGLLVSLTFSENELMSNELYREILNDRLSINEGMFYENVIAQMLVASGRRLFFYSHYDRESRHNDMEVDFLLSSESKVNFRIYPVEVKSSSRYSTVSLERFREHFRNRIGKSIIIHPKNYSECSALTKYPPYMIFCFSAE